MVVTKARVLIELGSTGGEPLESQITETIPKAEARYRTIAGYNFALDFAVSYTSGENFFTLSGCPDSLINDLNYGDLIDGTGVPSETYITDIDTINDKVTVNKNFTEDGTQLIIAQNIEYWPVISSIIYYLIGKMAINQQNKKEVLSKSVSPLSFTYDKSAINRRYGIPESLVQAIPSYAGLM